jgi:hypothetical protein
LILTRFLIKGECRGNEGGEVMTKGMKGEGEKRGRGREKEWREEEGKGADWGEGRRMERKKQKEGGRQEEGQTFFNGEGVKRQVPSVPS